MSEHKSERIVVSVGGSLIVPDEIDTAFLARFRELIYEKVGQGYSFYIITGGGKTCRKYQNAAREVIKNLQRDDLDWLGIHSSRLNGHLVRTVLKEHAYPRMIKNPTRVIETDAAIIVGAGWKPGWSTDHCAVLAAKTLGAKRIVNLSNIDHVYTDDPKKNPAAEKIEKISWADFRKLIPEEWDPGLSSPFDPVAAREAEESDLEVAIMNGANLGELDGYLEGKPFTGTVIS